MISLDKNYKVETDSTHGFKLLFESEPFKKEVIIKGEKVLKLLTTKDIWYYPKLSQVLKKYFSLCINNNLSEDILVKVIKIEGVIEQFSKTFAKKGSLLELKEEK